MAPRIMTRLALVFAPFVVAKWALAQEVTPQARAQAVEVFDSAMELSQAGRYSEACPKFSESYRLDPQLGALLHLADCLEQNGQLASAYAAFRDASELAAKKSDPRQDLADEQVKALGPRLSRLTVNVSAAARVPGLLVGRDGIAMDAATWGTPIALDPGEHHIAATAPGYKPWSATLNIAGEASTQSLDVPALEPLPPKPKPVEPPESQTDSGSTQRLLGYVAGGVGLVGLGLGVGFTVERKNKIDEANAICPSNQCAPGTAEESQTRLNKLNSDARKAGTIAAVSFVTGGVALAGGVALFLTAPSDTKRKEGALRLVPWFGPGGAGVVANRSF
jgi:serine/threonine-protein kinase